MRWGLGPVFAYEWLTTSRRWQIYAARSLFVGLLLVALSLVWWSQVVDQRQPLTIRAMATIGQQFFYAIIGTQLTLVLLAAPAATAGSVCLDKARGTLAHLLVTDLSNVEIVLGKLAARLIPVLGLVGCCLPILFLSTLFGGIDPGSLTAAFLVTLGVAVLGCTLAFTLSVWGTKTYEVLLANYMIWIVVLLAHPIWKAWDWHWKTTTVPVWVENSNPFYLAFAPYTNPGTTNLTDALAFLAVALAASFVLVIIAIARVRAVTIRQASRGERARKSWSTRLGLGRWPRWLPGPSLDANPVLWREWHRKRPSRWTAFVWSTYTLLAVIFTGIVIGNYIYYASHGRTSFLRNPFGPFVNAFQVAIGLLLLSVSAVTALAEERVRGSLDVLLVTPLPTRSIVWGKWWGTYRTVPLLAVFPGILIGVAAGINGLWGHAWLLIFLVLAYGAAITSLGLALATWISRLGRAVALSVTAFVLVTVGWLFVVLLFHLPGMRDEGMFLASPWYAGGLLTAEAEEPRFSVNENHLGWGIFWLAAYSGAAIALLVATLRTFDRCLGRITLRRRPPSPRLLPTLDRHAPLARR